MSESRPSESVREYRRLYIAMRQVMHAIVRSRSRDELLNELTRILVEFGGFAMAVATWHDPARHELVPVARFGDTHGYLDRIRLFADERPEGMGAAGISFREGRTSVVNDLLTNPQTQPWWDAARAAGWGAAASIPVRMGGVPQGTLGVYATEPGFFGPDERELLEEVAVDVGFALDNIERERQRREVEESLAGVQRSLSLALDAGGVAIFERNLKTDRVVWGGQAEKLLGFGPGGFDGSSEAFFSRVHPDDLPILNQALETSRRNRTPFYSEHRILWPDGSEHWHAARGEFVFDSAGEATLLRGASRDITEHHKADARFRTSLDSLMEACMLLDFNWTCLYVNETACRYAGRPAQDLVGKDLRAIFPGIGLSGLPDHFRRCMEERQSFGFEYAGQSGRWFQFSVSPIPEGIFILCLETSERRQAQEALRRSEERLAQALRVSNIGIFDHDHRTGEIYASPRQREIQGFGPDEKITLEKSGSRTHPDDRQRVDEAVARAHDPAGDGIFDVESRLLLPDGSVRWISTRAQTFFEGEGPDRRAVRTVGAIADLTAQKLAQDEQDQLAALVALNRDFVGIASLEGSAMYLNRAAMALIGLEDLSEIRGRSIADFLADPRVASDMLEGLARSGEWSGETLLRHFRGGDDIDVEIRAFTIRDDNGTPLYLATVTRDIRERKRAEAERARLETQLAQAQKMESIGRLAGGVAHDFNNMLTVILGYAAMARDTLAEDAPQQRYLNEIEKAGNRSKDITEKLLGFSRRQIIAPVPSNLNDVIADLGEPLARLIGEDVQMLFHPGEALWKVVIDHSQINQILLNLVVNARDAMPRGGKLTIETENVNVSDEYCRTQPGAMPGPHVLLAVSDTGVGMEPETLAHIFEPFFTTREHKGTGLGLATVYGVVKQNGGFINVYSEPAHGTTFKIYFPKLSGEPTVARTPSAVDTVSAGRGTILLVEDDNLVREMTTDALLAIGYTPLVASSPEQALALCSSPEGANIRLMLSDVVMPGMNGVALRDLVRAVNPKIKVLFMSGYTSNVIVNHGVLKKGVHFIQKPFTIGELSKRIAETLSAG